MNERIESAINEAVQTAIDEHLFCIRHNLTEVFDGLLYSLKLELEKQGGVSDISRLINIVVKTSKYAGPENKDYPVWNNRGNKEVTEIYKRLEKALQAHGIQQSWNRGKDAKEIQK